MQSRSLKVGPLVKDLKKNSILPFERKNLLIVFSFLMEIFSNSHPQKLCEISVPDMAHLFDN